MNRIGKMTVLSCVCMCHAWEHRNWEINVCFGVICVFEVTDVHVVFILVRTTLHITIHTGCAFSLMPPVYNRITQ